MSVTRKTIAIAVALSFCTWGAAAHVHPDLHPTPPCHPDASPDPIFGHMHPGYMNISTAPSGPHARWDDLVAGWKLDEESDTRADVLETYDLTDNNTVPSATGIIENGILPAAGNAESLSNPSVPTFTGDITLSFWVKRVGNATGTVVSRYTGANTNSSFTIISLSSTTIALVTVSGTTQSVGANLTLALDTWHLVTFRKAAGTSVGSLIRDDSDATASTASVGQPNAGGALPFHLGSNSTPAQHAGNLVIDEVYYFPDVLKDDDWISDLYNSGAGRSYPD